MEPTQCHHAHVITEKDVAAWLTGTRLFVALGKAQGQTFDPVVRKGSWLQKMHCQDWDAGVTSLLTTRERIDLIEHAAALRGETNPHTGVKIISNGLNQFPDWSLTNGKTLHLNLPRMETEATLELLDHVKINVPKGGRWAFEALLGIHRASGELELMINNHGRELRATAEFSAGKPGGKREEDYKQMRVEFDLKAGPSEITVRIRHKRHLAGQQNREDSFYFIANPSLREATGEGHGAHQPISRQFRSDQRIDRTAELFTAAIPLFSSADNEPLTLELYGQSLELFRQYNKNSIAILQEYGHAFELKAARSDRFTLYVNGKFCQSIEIGEQACWHSMPIEWLRGEPVLLQIRDQSGSQCYLSQPLLPARHVTPTELLIQETRRPYPTDLTVRANHRYRALRAHLENPSSISTDTLLRALDTLDGDYESVDLKPLKFPEITNPEVSVVIPAHNKLEATYYCLCALLLAYNKTSFEIILVDDGSTDQTAGIDQIVSGIRVFRNTEPTRFIRACNLGASHARGKYVVLLNNDTEVTSGWLDFLTEAFDRFPRVGAVGSKLLFPDGSLQDAGGIVWRSGNPWNYGNRKNPWDPRFCYTRQVDYLSGAALMTTKAIWDEVGGLSSYLEPMYFEDTDFSFKVREAGYKTYFVPASVVYHFEGTTSGTDITSGFKRYQEVNRPKFKRRWAKAYAHHGDEGVNPDLEKDRGISGRILFIDYTTPRQDRDAGSYAAIREIELVQALGYKVTFLPQNLAYLGNYTEQLQRMGVEVITSPFYLSLAAFLEERAREFEAAYITRYYVAADTVQLIREHSPKTRIILNNADLHFLRALRTAISENDDAKLVAMRDVRNQELAMMRSVDLVLSYNEVEHAVISSHTDGAVKVMTCPWVVDIPETVAPLEGRKGLSFLGSFKHHPNAEGVEWFCQDVMPHLEALQLKLSIYGSGMDDASKELASDWIDPVGYIEDVADAYQRHRVFIAPLLSGAGIKGKVLSALAYGVPTVLTPTAAEGIGLRHGYDCLIAKTTEEWVDGITQLCDDDDLWKSISNAARSYAASQYSFAAGTLTMKAALEAVDLFTHSDL